MKGKVRVMKHNLMIPFPQKNKLSKYEELSGEETCFLNQAKQYQELMMMYNCAMKEVRTKLEILNDELSMSNERNPIEFISSRIKKPISIANKLKKQGQEITVEAVEKYISDVAGIRVICSFVDDIYTVANMLIRQDDITLIKVKDYIKTPKTNGYRSLHLIVEIPVFFSDQKKQMQVEVQIRTIAMDFWASLEHELKYKKDIQDEDEIMRELKSCADVISQTDLKMLNIRNKIQLNQAQDFPTISQLQQEEYICTNLGNRLI